jgi:hypothetical protein
MTSSTSCPAHNYTESGPAAVEEHKSIEKSSPIRSNGLSMRWNAPSALLASIMKALSFMTKTQLVLKKCRLKTVTFTNSDGGPVEEIFAEGTYKCLFATREQRQLERQPCADGSSTSRDFFCDQFVNAQVKKKGRGVVKTNNPDCPRCKMTLVVSVPLSSYVPNAVFHMYGYGEHLKGMCTEPSKEHHKALHRNVFDLVVRERRNGVPITRIIDLATRLSEEIHARTSEDMKLFLESKVPQTITPFSPLPMSRGNNFKAAGKSVSERLHFDDYVEHPSSTAMVTTSARAPAPAPVPHGAPGKSKPNPYRNKP